VLNHSDSSLLLDKAKLILPYFLVDKDDLLDVLPLYLGEVVNSQVVIERFTEQYKIKIYWSNQQQLFADVVNASNPFTVIAFLKLLDKTSFTPIRWGGGNIDFLSIKEMLSSDTLPMTYKDYALTFLNKYSADPIQQEVGIWLEKLAR